MTPIAHIAELWRYPVKSMRGEQVDQLDLLPDGIAHDRRYAFESSAAPRGKPLLSGAERARMLLSNATVRNGLTHVRTPLGQDFAIDDPALLAALELTPGTLHLVRSTKPLTDVRPIALLSTETVAELSRELAHPVDARRFRANIVLDFRRPAAPDKYLFTLHEPVISTEAKRRGETCFPPADSDQPFPEEAHVGHTLRLGEAATIAITERIPRCRIVTLDPKTAQPNPALMKHLDRHHSGRIGIYATTLTPGPLRVGDPIHRIP